MYSPPLSSLIKINYVFLTLPLRLFFSFLIILIDLRKLSSWTSLLRHCLSQQPWQHEGRDPGFTSSCSLWAVPGKEEMKSCLKTHHSRAAEKSGRKCSKDRRRARVTSAPQQVAVGLLLPRIHVGSSSSSHCPLTPLCSFPGYCMWQPDKEQPPPKLDLSSAALPDQRHSVAPLFHSKGSLKANALLRPPFPGSYAAKK